MQLSQLLLSLLVSGLSVGSPLPAASSSASTGCTTYTMLFARGTGDPNLSTSAANMGTVVGPGLQTAVQKALGTSEITVQVRLDQNTTLTTCMLGLSKCVSYLILYRI